LFHLFILLFIYYFASHSVGRLLLSQSYTLVHSSQVDSAAIAFSARDRELIDYISLLTLDANHDTPLANSNSISEKSSMFASVLVRQCSCLAQPYARVCPAWIAVHCAHCQAPLGLREITSDLDEGMLKFELFEFDLFCCTDV
jgi:hypothetical protein